MYIWQIKLLKVIISISGEQIMKKTRNEFEGSQGDQSNEFMESVLNKSRTSNGLNVNKEEIIRKLQSKNNRLKMEVDKVNSVLGYELDGSSKRYGIKMPEVNKRVADKQLENAYKQIRVYEYQIRKKQKMDREGSYVEQIKRLENTLREKQELTEKLKKQIAEVNRQSLEFVRLLKDDNIKSQYQVKASQLHTEIKYLRQKIIDSQSKIAIAAANRERQRTFIEKLQNQLLKEGMQHQTLESIKAKILNRGEQAANYTQYNPNANNDENFSIEERTPQAYQHSLNEIKLLRKVQKDHQNKIKLLEKEREEAAQKNFQSRNQLLQIEHSIDKLSAQISELKSKIDPRNMIPIRALSMSRPSKLENPTKSPDKGKAAFTHLFRNEEVGQKTKLGKRFIDRPAIGKKTTLVVGVSLYEKQGENNQLVGLQASYLAQGVLKKGSLNLIDKKKVASPKTFQLEAGDYYKTIEIVMGGTNNYIIGLQLVSRKGEVAKAGNFNGNRTTLKLSPEQHPCCFYGSLMEGAIEMLGCQVNSE